MMDPIGTLPIQRTWEHLDQCDHSTLKLEHLLNVDTGTRVKLTAVAAKADRRR